MISTDQALLPDADGVAQQRDRAPACEALREYAAAVARACDADDAGLVVRALNEYASRASLLGELDLAERLFDDAIERAANACAGGERAADENIAPILKLLLANRAYLYVVRGDVANAWTTVARARAVDEGSLVADLTAAGVLVRLCTLVGNFREAHNILQSGIVERALQSKEPQTIACVAGAAVAYLNACGNIMAAKNLARRAIALLGSADFAWWLLEFIAASDVAGKSEARMLLVRAAEQAQGMARGQLALFDAIVASLLGNDAREEAAYAHTVFTELRCPREAAVAERILLGLPSVLS
ncbi:MAG: hypothetical protein M3R51_05290 [Candidatus Eremiobacteraeota bacterium]|nr:hypothetical protein [Candidatus Eremiobacteraeota bacterium]